MNSVIKSIDAFTEHWTNATWGDAFKVLMHYRITNTDINQCLFNLKDSSRDGIRRENKHTTEETAATILFLESLLEMPESDRILEFEAWSEFQ